MENFDVVIVGAGSAGCAIAGRLSEDSRRRVLLLEAGSRDWNPLIRMPVGEALTIGGAIDWKFRTEAEPGIDGRHLDAPRGKVLGGSSAINGQLYVRGHRGDFDDWAAAGCTGWGWDDVLPHFIRSESWAGEATQGRGSSGPLKTILGRYRTPLYEAFLQAGAQMGHSVRGDYNLGDHEGFAWGQFTQEHDRAARCSSAHAYLSAAKGRANLTIRTGAQVTGLTLDGTNCTGLSYVQGGQTHRIGAGEVVLSAGAYQSPHILMLAGIGDGEALRRAGITPRHDLPGVGQNLQDHCGGLIQSYCLQKGMTYNQFRYPLPLLRAVWDLYANKRGPLSVFPMNALAFLRSTPDQPRPDLEFLFFPVTADIKGGTAKYAAFDGYAVTWGIMRPRSRGSVTLASADPLAKPVIRHNYLTDPYDIATNIAGFKLAREINAQAAFAPFRGAESDPGPEVTSDADIAAYNRRTMGSHYHPSGSCRMGIGADAVVDPSLRVHGLNGLRVADASIMPWVTSGNTNAPSIMIGEKAAAMIAA